MQYFITFLLGGNFKMCRCDYEHVQYLRNALHWIFEPITVRNAHIKAEISQSEPF